MARRSDEPEAEPLDIVEGVIERVDLELAGVAGAGVDLPDRQAAAQPALAAPLNLAAIAINSGSDG